ncbi:hypothetical protein AMK59_6188, partial [Oryctes borbonicus]
LDFAVYQHRFLILNTPIRKINGGKIWAPEGSLYSCAKCVCIKECRFLDNIAVLMHSRDTESLNEFLSSVYKTKLAGPGKKFVVPFNKGENVSNFSFLIEYVGIYFNK